MKVGLIPPAGQEIWILKSDFHLTLAQRAQDKNYKAAYDTAYKRGDFIIVDNGANEGEAVLPGALTLAVKKLHGSEVVLPDVFYDPASTLARAEEYIVQYDDWKVRNMVVAQGRTVQEIKSMICKLSNRKFRRVGTIGLPRHLLETLNLPAVRIDLANWIHDTFGQTFSIHLLGTSHLWPSEVKRAAMYAPFIRSVDTSLPFNYAIANKQLDMAKVTDNIKRPNSYFADGWHLDPVLVDDNINTLMDWAGALPITFQVYNERPAQAV